MERNTYFPLGMLGILTLVTLWSAIDPHDRFTWILETLPVYIAVLLLFLTYHSFPLTNLLYLLIMLHGIVLLVGGHYTYARVPAFDWIKDTLGLARNYYDRVGHFAQGFVPAIVARELLLRTSPLKSGTWLFVVILFSCLGISAIYELIEWLVAVMSGEAAESFLGTQGDVWDTQKDMAIAGVGAALALIILSPIHDRALARLQGQAKQS